MEIDGHVIQMCTAICVLFTFLQILNTFTRREEIALFSPAEIEQVSFTK